MSSKIPKAIVVSLTSNFRQWANIIFPQSSFVYTFSRQISSLFSLYKLYNSYNLFSANAEFPLHVVLLIPKNVISHVHELVVVLFETAAAVYLKMFIICFNIIMKVGFPKDKKYIRKKRVDL